MSRSDAPNTKKITVAHEVPRDPAAYQPTIHFGQRLKERIPENHRDSIVRECLQRGRCHGVSDRKAKGHDDVRQCFGFDLDDDLLDATYRLVVGIRPTAFRQASTNHLAITIMEVHE
jgi:hypothetical protein